MAELQKLIKGDFEDVKKFVRDNKMLIREFKDVYMLSFSDDSCFTEKFIRQANGVIFEKDTNKILHYSFEKCYDGFEGTNDNFNQEQLGDDYSVEAFYEGSIIKVYFHKGTWNVATSRYIDAKNNFWSSDISFEDMFKEAVEFSHKCDYKDFINTLNTDYCYTFLIQHPANRMIYKVDNPLVFIVNRVNLSTLMEERVEKEIFKLDIKLNDFKNYNQNFIIYKVNDDKTVSRIKMLTEEYLNIKDARGNFPNIGLSYLNNLGDTRKIKILKDNIPDYNYKLIDRLFDSTSKYIYSLYIKKHIKKYSDVYIPKNLTKTVHQLHGQYRRTRVPITLLDVDSKLESLKPKTLAFVINYKY